MGLGMWQNFPRDRPSQLVSQIFGGVAPWGGGLQVDQSPRKMPYGSWHYWKIELCFLTGNFFPSGEEETEGREKEILSFLQQVKGGRNTWMFHLVHFCS